MNTLTKLGTIAAISLLALQPALAQDASSSAPAGDAAAPMAAAPAASLDTLLASLQAGASTDVSAVTDTSTVNVVTVSSVAAGGDTTALDAALDANADALATLRTNVAANAALSTKLTDAGAAADKVVAVVTEADGSVTVYVDDRA
jgi:hypothetical protein